MALIKCPECGKEISDTSKKCINCGYKLKKTERPAKAPIKKYIWIVPAVLVLVILAGGVGAVSYKMTFSTDNAVRCFMEGDYNKFDQITAKLSDEKRNDVSVQLQNSADDIVNQYNNAETAYEEASLILEQMKEFDDTQIVSEAIDRLKELKLSKDAFQAAGEAEKSGDLEKAFTEYGKVLKTDENYSYAENKTNELRTLISEEYISKAKELAAVSRYEEALETLVKAGQYDLENSEIKNMYIQYSNEYDELKESARQNKNQKDFFAETADCPITITSYYIRDNSIGNPTVSLSIKNNTDKAVDAYTARFYMYDNFNERVNHYLYDDNVYLGICQETIKANGTLNGRNYYWTPYGYENTTKFIAIITEVHFTDNSSWTMSDGAVEYAQIYADNNIADMSF